MVKLNLLPWRSEKKLKDKKALTAQAIVSSVVILCLLLIIHFSLNLKTEDQVKRNNALQTEIDSVNAALGKLRATSKQRETFLSGIKTLQTLQYNRFETVALFNQLAQLTPKGIYLNRVERFDTTILLDGESTANALISQLIKAIDLSQSFDDPILKEVHTQKIEQANITTFTISFKLKAPFQEHDINAPTGSKKKK